MTAGPSQPAGRAPANAEEVLSNRRLVFVVGAQGSGTSWTQRLIDAHPNAVCLFEPRTLHGIIAPMFQYQEMRYKNLQKFGRPQFNVKTQTVFNLSRQLFAALFEDRDLTDVTLIGEKTPENALRLDLIDDVFPGACYVWLHRDLRDALMPRYKAALRQDPDTDFLSYAELYFTKAALPYLDGFHEIQKRHPERTFAMRYEDMLADPVSGLRDLYTFLGLSTDESVMLEAIKATGTAHADASSLDGVPVLEPNLRGKVGTWRAHDSDAFQEIYARGAKQRNIDAGYDT